MNAVRSVGQKQLGRAAFGTKAITGDIALDRDIERSPPFGGEMKERLPRPETTLLGGGRHRLKGHLRDTLAGCVRISAAA